MRSSRHRFVPQTTWQVQLATWFAPLRGAGFYPEITDQLPQYQASSDGALVNDYK